MTVFDYGVLVIVLASIAISVWRGLVREILSLIGWVVAFVVANLFTAVVAPLLPTALGHPVLRMIVAFLLILVATILLMSLVNWAILRGIAAAGLQLADRGLGGLFGLARGVLIVIALALVAGMTRAPEFDFWKHALFSPLVETAVTTVLPFLPGDISSKVKF